MYFFKDSSIANTGDALWHVHNNIFNTEYDRPDAENVLVLITDALSNDDVEPAAKALKESGVTVGNVNKVEFKIWSIFSAGNIPAAVLFYKNNDIVQIKSFIILAVIRRRSVTSWRGPSPHHCALETQLLSKKCCSGG